MELASPRLNRLHISQGKHSTGQAQGFSVSAGKTGWPQSLFRSRKPAKKADPGKKGYLCMETV